MDHMSSNRTPKVTATSIRRATRDSALDEHWFKDRDANCRELWITSVCVKSGTLPASTGIIVHKSELAANESLSQYQTGSIFAPGQNEDDQFLTVQKAFGQRIFDEPELGRTFLSTPNDDGYLAWKTLSDAGLNDGVNLATKVSDYLGPERIKALRDIYGDNWQVAAEMEFCWYNLDSSSSAYVAAKHQYNFFVSQNDYAAGYLQRDLEILTEGVEDAVERATAFFEKQSKRSAKGGEANAIKAQTRRLTFFSLALKSVAEWIWKSENEQRRYLKGLALKSDLDTDEQIFQINKKPLSDSWFDQAISELRLSGELERAMTKKKP